MILWADRILSMIPEIPERMLYMQSTDQLMTINLNWAVQPVVWDILTWKVNPVL